MPPCDSMSDRVPPELFAALTPEERRGLTRALDRLGQELADLYADEVVDHREARGDNGQLFGMKIWIHGWFRYEELFADDRDVHVVSENGSWALHIGRLRIGIYRQGSHADEDVHQEIPHADSAIKRSYGTRNAAQLALFDGDLGRPTLDAASIAALLDLTITHFGNSRDGLVKWYIGAQSRPGHWGWVWRQPDTKPRWEDDSDGGVTPIRPIKPRRPGGDVVPFDQRLVPDVEITPRVRPARELRSEDPE
jgi:hypothetical protein